MKKSPILLGLAAGYTAVQAAWMAQQLFGRDVAAEIHTNHNTASITGLRQRAVMQRPRYDIIHTIEQGIERITYRPHRPRFHTPLVLQHGMWHGAWCWRPWQELWAEWGWESHAHSLPGHGQSPIQRPIRICTLDYYLSFLRQEVARQYEKPVLIGHSMGGALIQWYLKYVGDDLPAAVLAAPWVSHSMLGDGLLPLIQRDPTLLPRMMLDWSATPFVRSPARAAQCFLHNPHQALLTPAELYQQLGPESALVLFQHNPPFWSPPGKGQTPLLWLAGQEDTLLPAAAERQSAAHYGAEYHPIPSAGHNLMLEPSYEETAVLIHRWLAERVR